MPCTFAGKNVRHSWDCMPDGPLSSNRSGRPSCLLSRGCGRVPQIRAAASDATGERFSSRAVRNRLPGRYRRHGEVYRARDTRLGRVVAIKVYLEPLQARFEREARAISALNHPNICTLYDIGPDYLVMELVEGESLADRLKKGPLPIDKVLQYGAQIADALTTAHTQGIIHRDLKPGNVMETPKGIKLLDFGLAKYVTTDVFETAEITLTQRGAVLGTPAYMAPEQLEGHECDARTDIFAFGLVLFEMATGSRAFGGSSQAELISQIMHGEPVFEKVAPPAFRRLIERCLAKDPAKRWQTASDLKLALEDLGTKTVSTPVMRGALIATAKRRRLAWVVAVVGSGLVVAALAWMVDSQSAGPDSPKHKIDSSDH